MASIYQLASASTGELLFGEHVQLSQRMVAVGRTGSPLHRPIFNYDGHPLMPLISQRAMHAWGHICACLQDLFLLVQLRVYIIRLGLGLRVRMRLWLFRLESCT